MWWTASGYGDDVATEADLCWTNSYVDRFRPGHRRLTLASFWVSNCPEVRVMSVVMAGDAEWCATVLSAEVIWIP